MNKYFKKSTKRSVISILSIAITLCLLFSLLFPGKAVNAAPRMRLNKTAVTLIQGKMVCSLLGRQLKKIKLFI